MKKTALCTCCHTEHPTAEMVRTPMANRGGANAYMCQHCASVNQRYHATNNKHRGTEKQNALMVGIELETSYSDYFARNALFEYGLIPTHDCSLESDGIGCHYGNDGNTCEYVTGIIRGLNIPSKMAVTIETLMQGGHLKINDSCGTHFHVSIDSMRDENGQQVYMNYIRRFYHSLFVPLCEAMQANPEATEKLHGRPLNDNYYAQSIDRNSNTGSRYLFINVTNDSNIEFRLNRYKNAKQFQTLMKFEVEIVKAVITNFCQHFNDTPKDARRYPTMTAYRTHKAQVTAQKLVEIFNKYANQI